MSKAERKRFNCTRSVISSLSVALCCCFEIAFFTHVKLIKLLNGFDAKINVKQKSREEKKNFNKTVDECSDSVSCSKSFFFHRNIK